MNPNKALWEKGDFTRIAESMRESGEALVRRLGITKGLKVLDLGCGDGTTALLTRGHRGCWMLTIWFALTCCTVVIVPSGHRTSSESTSVAAPRPKCSRMSC
jgi:hypothetical protein